MLRKKKMKQRFTFFSFCWWFMASSQHRCVFGTFSLSLSLSLSPLLFICLIVEKSCNLKTSIQFKRFSFYKVSMGNQMGNLWKFFNWCGIWCGYSWEHTIWCHWGTAYRNLPGGWSCCVFQVSFFILQNPKKWFNLKFVDLFFFFLNRGWNWIESLKKLRYSTIDFPIEFKHLIVLTNKT